MPIRIQYQPSAGVVGRAAYRAGLGQYRKWLAEMRQRNMLEQFRVTAREEAEKRAQKWQEDQAREQERRTQRQFIYQEEARRQAAAEAARRQAERDAAQREAEEAEQARRFAHEQAMEQQRSAARGAARPGTQAAAQGAVSQPNPLQAAYQARRVRDTEELVKIAETERIISAQERKGFDAAEIANARKTLADRRAAVEARIAADVRPSETPTLAETIARETWVDDRTGALMGIDREDNPVVLLPLDKTAWGIAAANEVRATEKAAERAEKAEERAAARAEKDRAARLKFITDYMAADVERTVEEATEAWKNIQELEKSLEPAPTIPLYKVTPGEATPAGRDIGLRRTGAEAGMPSIDTATVRYGPGLGQPIISVTRVPPSPAEAKSEAGGPVKAPVPEPATKPPGPSPEPAPGTPGGVYRPGVVGRIFGRLGEKPAMTVEEMAEEEMAAFCKERGIPAGGALTPEEKEEIHRRVKARMPKEQPPMPRHIVNVEPLGLGGPPTPSPEVEGPDYMKGLPAEQPALPPPYTPSSPAPVSSLRTDVAQAKSYLQAWIDNYRITKDKEPSSEEIKTQWMSLLERWGLPSEEIKTQWMSLLERWGLQ